MARDRMALDQKGSFNRCGHPGREESREDFGLIEMALDELETIDGDRKNGFVSEIRSNGLCQMSRVFAEGFEQIVLARVLNAVKKLFDGGVVGIGGPNVVEVFETFFDECFLERPGERFNLLGACPAENLFLKSQTDFANLAGGGIEKAN